MGVAGGPYIVRDSSLVLELDAADRNSYVSGSNVWYDVSGNSNNGTLTNGPTFLNSAITFDGTNDYVIISPQTNIPTGSSARSVSLWFYTNSSTWVDDIHNLFFYGAGSNGNSFGIDFGSYPIMQVYTWGGSGRDLLYSSSFSQTGWKNISVTYNGSNTILIYENGIFTQTLTLLSPANTTSSNIYIGAIQPGTAGIQSYFTGSIATTYIYNRALSATEVLQNYNALKSRFNL